MNFIKVKNLNFTYKNNGFKLNNINFEIEKGEIAALIGPNGAGKTTVSKILCGIIENFSGVIWVNEKNIKELSAIEKAKKISYIPQIFEGLFDYTVEEIIFMGRRPFSNSIGFFSENDKKIVKDLLIKFNLLEKKDKKFFMLSGGEKRIVLIARAICQNSDFIILDEPLAYLDILHQIELVNILNELKGNGKTILLVLHDINLASEICDKIILLNNGNIIKSGKINEVLNKNLIKNIYKINNFKIGKNPVTNKTNIFIFYKNKTKGGKR